MEQQQQQQQHGQVAEAALAMVRPTTDSTTRAAASRFLEEWTNTDQAWNVYVDWIRSFSSQQQQRQQQQSSPSPLLSSNNSNNNGTETQESVGMQLLCLQLLQSKIRKDVPRGSTRVSHSNYAALEAIHSELVSYLRRAAAAAAATPAAAAPQAPTVPACICVAALSVRCGNAADLIAACRSSCCRAADASSVSNGSSPQKLTNGGGCSDSNHPLVLPSETALRLLSHVPLETESCPDFTGSQATAELWPYLETVLDTVRIALSSSSNHNHHHAAAATTTAALDALLNWSRVCHVTLTHLNTPTCGGTDSVLPHLVNLLSSPEQHQHQQHQQQQPSETVLVRASEALTEALLVPADSCTESRAVATRYLFRALSSETEFCIWPLRAATAAGWDDACHAVATAVCTAVTEEVDDLVSVPANPVLIQLLLSIQNHPCQNVRMTALDVWLTIQEVPTSQRHEDWKIPLFGRVVEGLLSAASYPEQFCDWQQQHDVLIDESEFDEFRRMAADVLVSSYFLLRGDYVSTLSRQITASQYWTVQEVALYGLTAAARDACQRVNTKCAGGVHGGNAAAGSSGSLIVRDRDRTCHELLLLLRQLMLCGGASSNGSSSSSSSSSDPPPSEAAVAAAASRHPLVLAGVTRFVGAYAATWSTRCSAEAILQILSYLRAVLLLSSSSSSSSSTSSLSSIALLAAKSAKSILTGCSNVLLVASSQAMSDGLVEMAEASLSSSSSSSSEAAEAIAEGCTRLFVQMEHADLRLHSLTNLVGAVLRRAEAAVNAVTAAEVGCSSSSSSSSPPAGAALSETAFIALDSLGTYLRVLQVIVRFCDAAAVPNGGGNKNNSTGSAAAAGASDHPVCCILHILWPFLDRVSQTVAVRHDKILETTFAVQEQLAKNAPEAAYAHLDATVRFAVGAYETTKHPAALGYVSVAVEAFGGGGGGRPSSGNSHSGNGNSNNHNGAATAAEGSFRDLLSHVSAITFQHLSTERPAHECPEVVRAYFEMSQRYMLYCPSALVHCPQFASITSLAAECCVSLCRGERESTRAALNYLSHVFGWRSLLRLLSPERRAVLESAARVLDGQVAAHGGSVTRSCLSTMLSGPQVLWPACTDCLFAAVTAAVSWPATAAASSSSSLSSVTAEQQQQQQQHDPASSSSSACARSTVAGQWMELAKPEDAAAAAENHHHHGNGNNIHNGSGSVVGVAPHGAGAAASASASAAAASAAEVYRVVVDLLLRMAVDGPKNKAKARMLLTDYCKIHRGEMSPDALITYQIA